MSPEFKAAIDELQTIAATIALNNLLLRVLRKQDIPVSIVLEIEDLKAKIKSDGKVVVE